ncbi:MAG: lipoprotein, partial [Candidatus Puniceispirillales bacterium]
IKLTLIFTNNIFLKRIKMRVFATMFVLFASLSLAGCGQSGDPEINKLLDNFESLVSDFEKMANQDKVCFSEVGEIMPKLMSFGSSMQSLQSAGKEPNDDQRQRAAKLAMRLQQSQGKLNAVQPDMSC